MSMIQDLKSRTSLKTAGYRIKKNDLVNFLKLHYNQSRTYDLSIDKAHTTIKLKGATTKVSPPLTLTLITPKGLTGHGAELLVGHTPIRKSNWFINKDTQTLHFNQGTGDHHLSGTLHILGYGLRITGILQAGEQSYQVTAQLKPIYYDCKTGQGAVDAAGQNKNVTLKWNTDSREWKDAQWTQERNLRFTYQIIKEGTYGGQTVFFIKVSFEDRTDPDHPVTWTPPGFNTGMYTAYATPDMYFNFKTNEIEPPNTSSLFPYLFNVQMSPDANSFTGGILTGKDSVDGTTYGLQGVFGGIVNGIYSVERDGKVQGFITAVNGEIGINGSPVKKIRNKDHSLSWEGLSDSECRVSGLPSSGHMTLNYDKDRWHHADSNTSIRAIGSEKALNQINSMAPGGYLHKISTQTSETLSINELMTFSQFGQPDGKTWEDVVQNASTKNTFDILLYYMDDNLREKFVSLKKPDLDPTIKGIAQMKGPKGEDPKDWYSGLGVSYVASNQGKFSSDKYAANLNWKRASADLNQQIQTAGVMHNQGPALYANQYGKVNDVHKYLVDQKNNDSRYNQALEQEIDKWIDDTVEMANGTPDVQKKIRTDMEKLKSTTLKNKTYWAYVMCRTFISPHFLTFLEAIGISPDQGSSASAFARRLQETSALLSVLDDSGVFTQKFVEIIEAFDLACIVPKLINYSGNVDDYYVAIQAILDGFVKQYINNPAPGMKEAAEAIEKAMKNDEIKDVLDAFANAMTGVVGSSGFEAAVEAYNSKVAKILGVGSEFVASAVMMASIGFTLGCLMTGQVKWSDLSDVEKASFIISAGAFLAMTITKLVVRGVSVNVLLNPDDGFFTAFKYFFSPFLKKNAQRSIADGIKGWLVGGNDIQGEIEGLQIQKLFAESVEEEAQLESSIAWRQSVSKYLGANLDEFVATRLGAVLALAGMAFSIYGLATSKNPYETAANACFLAASTLDFFIAVGTWAIAAEVTEIGGVAIASILPFLSAFALLAFIAGAVLIIVLLFVCKPEDPLEKFAKDQAKKSGFYMPQEFAIDYFEVYQPEGETERIGLSFMFEGKSSQCITIGSDGSLSLGSLNYTPNTVFYLKVDYLGRAAIAAPILTSDGKIDTRMLVVDKKTGKLTAIKPDVNTPTDIYSLWICDAKTAATKDDKKYESGTFSMYNAGLYNQTKKKQYLSAQKNLPVVSETEDNWLLSMEATKIPGIQMNDITMKSNWKDQSFQPQILNTCSGPFTWSISPAVPDFMTFDSKTGKISQKPQTKPEITKLTEYNLTVTNGLNRVSTHFKFEVQKQAALASVTA